LLVVFLEKKSEHSSFSEEKEAKRLLFPALVWREAPGAGRGGADRSGMADLAPA
jgi:hypothetical protein